jgi:hypothetical protein
MKRIICSLCIGTLALSVTAWAREDSGNTRFKAKGKARTSSAVQNVSANRNAHVMRNAGQVNSARSFSNARFNRQSNQLTAHSYNNAVVHHNNVQNARINTVRQRNFQSAHVQARNNVTINRQRNLAFNRQRNGTINNNWRGERFSGRNYAAFRNYRREWHHRDWWRHNHSRITFYFGAPYYWDTGYWYPAWGYYPNYVYQYDGPIYGYNDLALDQVVVNVQIQLQREGYYPGPVDGILGPMTRRAIAAFQADHGLAITSSIDEPTLATLGLV